MSHQPSTISFTQNLFVAPSIGIPLWTSCRLDHFGLFVEKNHLVAKPTISLPLVGRGYPSPTSAKQDATDNPRVYTFGRCNHAHL